MLSEPIFKSKYKGRIVDVFYEIIETGYVTQGIKKESQPFFDANYYGSNGSYAGTTFIFRNLNVKVYFFDFLVGEKNLTTKFDERDFFLNFFNRRKVTDKFVLDIKNRLKGKKITIHYKDPKLCENDEYHFQLDKEELKSLLVT